MKILMTGSSGLLGTHLKKYIKCDSPTSKELDITKKLKIDKNYDVVIHCAGYTDVARAEIEKEKCFKINTYGTYNLASYFNNSYFIYISTEYAKKPVNFYSYTKLWGEEMVKKYVNYGNYLIIRTLFKARPYPYEYAFFDQYTKGDYVDMIAPLIAKMMFLNTHGLEYAGTGRKTLFELARQTKSNIKAISVKDIKDVNLPADYL